MRVEAFRVEDLDRIDNFGGQESLVASLPRDEVAAAICNGNHYSLFSGARLAACIGFLPLNEWRCTAWSVLRSGMPELFPAVHKAARRLLLEQPWPRTEIYVDPRSERAMRWAQLLGFSLETAYKPYFFPDGSPASEWVFLKSAG